MGWHSASGRERWGAPAGRLGDPNEAVRSQEEGGVYTLEDRPRFAYRSLALKDRLENVWTDLILLVLWNALFFVSA